MLRKGGQVQLPNLSDGDLLKSTYVRMLALGTLSAKRTPPQLRLRR